MASNFKAQFHHCRIAHTTLSLNISHFSQQCGLLSVLCLCYLNKLHTHTGQWWAYIDIVGIIYFYIGQGIEKDTLFIQMHEKNIPLFTGMRGSVAHC